MSTEENKAVVRRMFEEDKRRNLAGISALFAPNYVWHGAERYGLSPDLTGLKQMTTAGWTAFPDLHYTVEDLIVEGDKVVYRMTMRGTHQGDFMGIPPTGKQVSWTGIEIARIEDDKFVETWADFDALGLMQQLGVIAQMAQTGA